MVRDGMESESCGGRVPDFSIKKPEPIIKPKIKRGLPCPDPVDVPPLRNPPPSRGDVGWMNVQRAGGSIKRGAKSALRAVPGYAWNATRHFIILGGGAALASVTGGASLAVVAKAFLVGGAIGVARKTIDLKRTASGKPDLLTAAKNRITRTGGDGMGIRTEVGEFQAKLYDLVMIFFDETPDKDQVMDIAGGAWSTFNEASDLKDISKEDMAKAGADTAITLAAVLKDKFIKYSDEVPE